MLQQLIITNTLSHYKARKLRTKKFYKIGPRRAQYHDTQHNYTQLRELFVELKVNDTKHNNTVFMLCNILFIVMLNVNILNVIIWSVKVPWQSSYK